MPSWTPDWRDSTPRYGQLLPNEAFYLQTDFPLPVADFDDAERTVRVRGFMVGQLTDVSMPLYKSQHRSADNNMLTLVLSVSSALLVPAMGLMMKTGIALWLVRFLRRRASARIGGILESIEITLSRKPEVVEGEYSLAAVNLAETANSFDCKEAAWSMFRPASATLSAAPNELNISIPQAPFK